VCHVGRPMCVFPIEKLRIIGGWLKDSVLCQVSNKSQSIAQFVLGARRSPATTERHLKVQVLFTLEVAPSAACLPACQDSALFKTVWTSPTSSNSNHIKTLKRVKGHSKTFTYLLFAIWWKGSHFRVTLEKNNNVILVKFMFCIPENPMVQTNIQHSEASTVTRTHTEY